MSEYRHRAAAVRAPRKLDPPVRQRVRGVIALLAQNPRPRAARALKGRPGLRVRVGETRIVYTFHDDVLLVIVVTLGHRRDVYDGVGGRRLYPDLMHEMTPDECRAFLAADARTGKLATVRRDGRPHVVPVWFVVDDDGSLLFTTGADTVKGRTLRRRGQAMLCVDDDAPPFTFVTAEGPVEISEDPEEMLAWATRIGGRYMGGDRAEEFGRRNAVVGELLVRLRPERLIGKADLTA